MIVLRRGRRTVWILLQLLLEGRQGRKVWLLLFLFPAEALLDDYGIEDGRQGQRGAVMAQAESLVLILHDGAEVVVAEGCRSMSATLRAIR